MADCRKCKYFMPVREFNDSMIEEALILNARDRVKVLGYCQLWEKYITYYRGKCRGFTPRSAGYKQKTLKDYGLIL